MIAELRNFYCKLLVCSIFPMFLHSFDIYIVLIEYVV